MEPLEVCQHWLKQADTLRQLAALASEQIDQGLAMQKQAAALDDKRTVAAVSAEVARARSSYLVSEKMLLGMTRTDNLTAASTLLVDLRGRISAAEMLFANWRGSLASAALVNAVGSKQQQPNEDAVTQAAVGEMCYHIAVEQACQMLPTGAADELLR